MTTPIGGSGYWLLAGGLASDRDPRVRLGRTGRLSLSPLTMLVSSYIPGPQLGPGSRFSSPTASGPEIRIGQAAHEEPWHIRERDKH